MWSVHTRWLTLRPPTPGGQEVRIGLRLPKYARKIREQFQKASSDVGNARAETPSVTVGL